MENNWKTSGFKKKIVIENGKIIKNDEINFNYNNNNFDNNYLIKKNKIILETTEKYDFDGDFIESQAFGYLAIRSLLNLPISFPETTGCRSPITGGILVNNF